MTNKQPVGKRQTLEQVLDKCDNQDLWTPTQIICFISDYLDGSIGEELPEDNQTIRENRTVELSKEVLEAMEDLRGWLKEPLRSNYEYDNIEKGDTLSQNLLNALDNQFNSNKEFLEKQPTISNSQTMTEFHKNEAKKWSDAGRGDYYSSSLYAGRRKDEKETQLKLEARFNNIESSKIDTKGSIWKPVSELPEEDIDVLLETVEGVDYASFNLADKKFQMKNGVYYVDSFIVRYCTLTDFINQHNSLQDRVERLERIIGGKDKND